MVIRPRSRRPHHPTPQPAPIPTSSPAPASDRGPLLYTPAEAARKLQVGESWLRKKAAARQVPCTFLGKHLRFSPTDLAAIITQAAQAAIGRKPRRRTAPTIRDRDLPPPAQPSVHAHHDDPTSDDGSTPWHG